VVVSGGVDGTVRVWDPTQSGLLELIDNNVPEDTLAFAPEPTPTVRPSRP
jgi:hypothetical protein